MTFYAHALSPITVKNQLFVTALFVEVSYTQYDIASDEEYYYYKLLTINAY